MTDTVTETVPTQDDVPQDGPNGQLLSRVEAQHEPQDPSSRAAGPVESLETPNSGAKPNRKDAETETDATAESAVEEKPEMDGDGGGEKATPIVSTSKKSRPPYKYDPSKVTLRFLFANRDGLAVTVECKPSDTVAEVKAALMSVWPEDLPACEGGESLRLVCMGKGYLTPDSRSLEDCQVPVFKTHPTPINVSIRPAVPAPDDLKKKKKDEGLGVSGVAVSGPTSSTVQASQGCACVIL